MSEKFRESAEKDVNPSQCLNLKASAKFTLSAIIQSINHCLITNLNQTKIALYDNWADLVTLETVDVEQCIGGSLKSMDEAVAVIRCFINVRCLFKYKL